MNLENSRDLNFSNGFNSALQSGLLSVLLPLEEVVHVVDQVGARVVLAKALHHQPRPRLQVAAWSGFPNQHVTLLKDNYTEMRFNLCTWLGDNSSCSCLTVLPGPGWVFTVPLTSLQVITSLIQFFPGGNSKNFGTAS